LFSISLHFRNTVSDPRPTAASPATCILSNSTYKLSISKDIMNRNSDHKIASKTSYRESLALDNS